MNNLHLNNIYNIRENKLTIIRGGKLKNYIYTEICMIPELIGVMLLIIEDFSISEGVKGIRNRIMIIAIITINNPE